MKHLILSLVAMTPMWLSAQMIEARFAGITGYLELTVFENGPGFVFRAGGGRNLSETEYERDAREALYRALPEANWCMQGFTVLESRLLGEVWIIRGLCK